MRASRRATRARASNADAASVCALLSQSGALFAGALRVNARKRHQGYVTLEGVTGDVLVADYTQVAEIKVAGLNFANLPVAFADAEPFKRFGLIKRPALMLGMDAMKLFKRVQIDFPNRTRRLALPKDAIAP